MSFQGRWTLVLGSVLAVTILGSWGCCSVTCCGSKPRTPLPVVVKDDKGGVDLETIVISKSKHEEVVWLLPAGSKIERVEITLGGKPRPFVRCDDKTAGACGISCEHGLCFSGPINPKLKPPDVAPPEYGGRGIYYAYGFAPIASSDPGIRIDP